MLLWGSRPPTWLGENMIQSERPFLKWYLRKKHFDIWHGSLNAATKWRHPERHFNRTLQWGDRQRNTVTLNLSVHSGNWRAAIRSTKSYGERFKKLPERQSAKNKVKASYAISTEEAPTIGSGSSYDPDCSSFDLWSKEERQRDRVSLLLEKREEKFYWPSISMASSRGHCKRSTPVSALW